MLFLNVTIGQKTHYAASILFKSILPEALLLLRSRAILHFGQWFRVMVYPSRIFSQSIFMANDLEVYFVFIVDGDMPLLLLLNGT